MVEHLIEVIQRPHILLDRCRPPPLLKPVDNSKNVAKLIKRIDERRETEIVEGQLWETIRQLRRELKFLKHFPKCPLCQAELMIDVERYLGKHMFWWLCLENSEYLEEQYPDIPMESAYHIGNYWEQVKWFNKHGNTDVPGENTYQFILDRANWAFNIYGKQIHAARQMLRLVKTWDFSEAQHQDYMKLYEKLGTWQIIIPGELTPFFLLRGVPKRQNNQV